MNTKRVAIWGSTGLAGGGVLRACLAAPEVAEVVAVTRRPLAVDHAKLRQVHCEDFANLGPVASAIGAVDACFYCLGTASSGVPEARYRLITETYALEAARTLKATSPAHTFHFVSGNGTRVDSRMMWARVKGETEEGLKKLGLSGILCYRPGAILADHAPSGGSWALRAAYPLIRLMRFLPSLSIAADALGFAMLQLMIEDQREGTLDNLAIRAAAERYQARGAAAAT